ncbi:hypothetical protein XELAEV_18024686mg [Xenopus laevis]|uniref:GIY-YIG domain-containing protein n=1 Tax=Xenopus laevis TaxID=8355 RepID=A0A974HL78_XENLA|nr:hypothetical protein XELAEV_18024686mg [Xenopus laevis]
MHINWKPHSKGPLFFLFNDKYYLQKQGTVKFDPILWEFIYDLINFLDIMLNGQDDGVMTTLYRKSCAANTILQASSFHPKHLIKNVPTGQLLRLRHLCSDFQEFVKQSCSLSILTKVLKTQRDSLLQKYSSKKLYQFPSKHSGTPLCILTFSPQLSNIKNIIKKHLPMLQTDDKLKPILGPICKFFTRKSDTLGKSLSPSVICDTKSFASNITNKSYKIGQYINSGTKNVKYLITCRNCNMQYVGQTSLSLRERIREHISDIWNKKPTNVSKHFLSCTNGNTNHFQIKVIERVTVPYRSENILQKILKQEVFWIFTLDTRLPKGLNSDFDVSCYYD